MVARFRAASVVVKGQQAVLTTGHPVQFQYWHFCICGCSCFILGGICVFAWLLFDL